MSDVSPPPLSPTGVSGLSLDSTLLSPLLFFYLVLLLFLSYLFSACWSILLNFFQKILQYFSLRDRLFFWYGSCLAARRSKLVGGMCSMLPFGTGIGCFAFIFYLKKKLLLSIPFFFFFYTLKKKSGIDKSTEWSTIPACPSLTCFSGRGNTERTNSSKILFLTFVYVLLHVNLCQD